MVDRKSPTPPHNTSQFAAWIDFAETAIAAIQDYPGTDETAEMCLSLEHYRLIFSGWAKDAVTRPAPADRLPIVSEFLPVRGQAFDLLVRLAKAHPGIASAVAARHRTAAKKST